MRSGTLTLSFREKEYSATANRFVTVYVFQKLKSIRSEVQSVNETFKLEMALAWSLGKYLIWESEKAFENRPRRSPNFILQGRECYLMITFHQDRYGKYCSLLIGCENDSELSSFEACYVTVYMKLNSGYIVMVQVTKQKPWKPVIWFQSERTIQECIGSLFGSCGLLKFYIFFGDYCDIKLIEKKHTHKVTTFLPLNKAIQTDEKRSNKAIQTDEKRSNKAIQTNEKRSAKSVQTLYTSHALTCLDDLSDDFAKLLPETSSFDVDLHCGDHKLGAHKLVLSTRSAVFAKMLTNDMAEGRTGEVNIQDMEYDNLMEFIRYLYSGKLPELTFDSAVAFYEAGDKYAVKGLGKPCSDYLVDSLTIENCCELLVLADNHSDQDFKELIIAYILENKSVIVGDDWKAFCKARLRLANEVLNRFCQHLLFQVDDQHK